MNSFIAGSAFCPGLPNREPTDSEKRLRVYKSSATMARHAWRVDKDSTKRHKNGNARLDAVRSAIPPKIVCLYGFRCELVKQTSEGDELYVHVHVVFVKLYMYVLNKTMCMQCNMIAYMYLQFLKMFLLLGTFKFYLFLAKENKQFRKTHFTKKLRQAR